MVTIKDVIEALQLDGYFPPEDIITLPTWFKIFVSSVLILCLVISMAKGLRFVIRAFNRE